MDGPLCYSLIEASRAIEDQISRHLTAYQAAWGIDLELVTRSGNPFKQLVVLGREAEADEIVVAESKQHRIARSLRSRLLHRGRWVVTVVPGSLTGLPLGGES